MRWGVAVLAWAALLGGSAGVVGAAGRGQARKAEGGRAHVEAVGSELDSVLADSLVDDVLTDPSFEELDGDRDEWLDALDQIVGGP